MVWLVCCIFWIRRCLKGLYTTSMSILLVTAWLQTASAANQCHPAVLSVFLQSCPEPIASQNKLKPYRTQRSFLTHVRNSFLDAVWCLTIQGLGSELSWSWWATLTQGILHLSAVSLDTQESTRIGRDTAPITGSNITLIWALSSSHPLSAPPIYEQEIYRINCKITTYASGKIYTCQHN